MRRKIFQVRTFLFYGALALVGVWMLVQMIKPPGEFLYYSFLVITSTFILCLLLSIVLIIPVDMGILQITSDHLILTTDKKKIVLDKVCLLLNVSSQELEDARKSMSKSYQIASWGHYLDAEPHEDVMDTIEIIISTEEKKWLVSSNHPDVKIQPQFDVRPGLMESPLTIVKTLFSVIRKDED